MPCAGWRRCEDVYRKGCTVYRAASLPVLCVPHVASLSSLSCPWSFYVVFVCIFNSSRRSFKRLDEQVLRPNTCSTASVFRQPYTTSRTQFSYGRTSLETERTSPVKWKEAIRPLVLVHLHRPPPYHTIPYHTIPYSSEGCPASMLDSIISDLQCKLSQEVCIITWTMPFARSMSQVATVLPSLSCTLGNVVRTHYCTHLHQFEQHSQHCTLCVLKKHTLKPKPPYTS